MRAVNLVAIYNSVEEAEQARDLLIAAGIPPDDIETAAPGTKPGMFTSLFRTKLPRKDEKRYADHLTGHRLALLAHVPDEECRARAIEVMDAFNPIDIEDADKAEAAPDVGDGRRFRVQSYSVEEAMGAADEDIGIVHRRGSPAADLPPEAELVERREEGLVRPTEPVDPAADPLRRR